ncbi:MAG: tRNA pseudouridine(38-40) synthase TruA, partial [Tannerella sp.]|nr:tRNA pseudouridine(38-40) synthase TruA [Tannerella sp.]
GRGKRSIEDFRQTIEAKDRRLAGSSADAHGLSLASVEYPEEVFRI